MGENYHEFHLSIGEMRYICQLARFGEGISKIINAQHESNANSATIKLSPSEVEELRGALTIKMADLGFGQDYLPNQHGQMLEKLIDRFLGP